MNNKEIEKKWQDIWEKEQVFKAEDFSDKPKFYGLLEFPYPSGVGLHMGHIKAYSSLETVSISKTVKIINDNAFYICSKIESIELPGVETVQDKAFEGIVAKWPDKDGNEHTTDYGQHLNMMVRGKRKELMRSFNDMVKDAQEKGANQRSGHEPEREPAMYR